MLGADWSIVNTDGKTLDQVYSELWKTVADAIEASKKVT